MIKLENTEVLGWEASIRGCRNPMNSWEKSDSKFIEKDYEGDYIYHTMAYTMGYDDEAWNYIDGGSEEAKTIKGGLILGSNDQKLMMNLAKAGSVDAKYRRMIVVTVDITAPLYWWKEFDTYKVGTVANSCSTMHKIQAKEFTLEDFSCEHLGYYDLELEIDGEINPYFDTACETIETTTKWPMDILKDIIESLNWNRGMFLQTHDKRYWWQMIQLLPSSYNQRRTVMLNYEVLAGIYPKRKNHKLDEWHDFCDWIESLPYSEIITLQEGDIHGEEAT